MQTATYGCNSGSMNLGWLPEVVHKYWIITHTGEAQVKKFEWQQSHHMTYDAVCPVI